MRLDCPLLVPRPHLPYQASHSPLGAPTARLDPLQRLEGCCDATSLTSTFHHPLPPFLNPTARFDAPAPPNTRFGFSPCVLASHRVFGISLLTSIPQHSLRPPTTLHHPLRTPPLFPTTYCSFQGPTSRFKFPPPIWSPNRSVWTTHNPFGAPAAHFDALALAQTSNHPHSPIRAPGPQTVRKCARMGHRCAARKHRGQDSACRRWYGSITAYRSRTSRAEYWHSRYAQMYPFFLHDHS
jgi:hypothetical protein